MVVQSIPASERPRERLLALGPAALSLRECLALLVGTGPRHVGCLGVASAILERPGPGLADDEAERALFTALEVAPLAHLRGTFGLGDAGAARVLAGFELGRRYAAYRESSRRASREPTASFGVLARSAIARIPQARRDHPQEWLGFVPLHRSGVVGDLCVVESGVRTHVNTDPVELFARILALRPQGFFLFHNHPGGTLVVSTPDQDLTTRVARIASQLGIRMLGHWIVVSDGEKLIAVV